MGESPEKSSIVGCLYYYWRILGLCPFRIRNGRLKPSILEIIATVMRCAGYFYLFTTIGCFNRSTFTSGSIALITGLLSITIQFVLVLTVWIISITRVQKIENTLRKFISLHQRLQDMGLQDCSWWDIFRGIACHCVFVNLFFFLHSTISTVISIVSTKQNYPVLLYQYTRVIVWNFNILFVDGVLVIKKKFQCINEAIENFHYFLELRSTMSHQVFYIAGPGAKKNAGEYLKSMGEVHEELKDLLHSVENIFGVPILLSIVVNSTECSSCMYVMAGLYRNIGSEWSVQEMASMTTFSIWCIANLIQMLLIVSISSLADEEANRTGSTLHYMWTTYRPRNTRFVVESVSLRLLQEKTVITLHGLIRLNFPLIYQLANVVLGSLVIMIQLEEHDQLFREHFEMRLEFPGLPFDISSNDNTSEIYNYTSTRNPSSELFEIYTIIP